MFISVTCVFRGRSAGILRAVIFLVAACRHLHRGVVSGWSSRIIAFTSGRGPYVDTFFFQLLK